MSLQVWLPLIKDLRNQGLATITSTGTPVFKNIGKIGSKSLDLNTRINFNCAALANIQTFSIAFWAKTNQDSNITGDWMDVLGFTDISTSESSGQLRWETCYTYGAPTRGISAHNNATYATVQGPSGQASIKGNWNHFCITVDPLGTGRAVEYQDGVKIGDFAANGGHLTGSFWTGETNKVNGEIQDIRIYDHALSPMEVKRISQGLVLHYPLNRGGFGQENLLSRYVVPGQAAPTSTAAGGRTTWLGDYKITIPATENADTYFRLFTTKQLTINATYTISCKVDGLLSGSYYRFPLYARGNTAMGVLNLDHNGLCSLTFTMTYGTQTAATGADGETVYICFMDDSTRAIASGQGAITISNFKLEEGSIVTPWCPSSSDTLAITMDLNSTIEYDCSGFCNNGEYYAYDTNGSISYTSDTPKYSVSTHIASANPTQSAASGTRYLYGHCELTNPMQMSVAFWLKPITGGYGGTTSNGQGYFCTTNYEYGTTSVGSDYQGSAMNHRDGAVNMNDSASTTQCNVTFYPTIGEWHHYVYTYDGQVGRGYKDGVQATTAQFSAAKTLDSFIGVVIGFSKAGGVWRRNDACYSDFRIYATALSAEDVKALYENSAYIATDGTMYAYDFVES